jgi:hypothetical protein
VQWARANVTKFYNPVERDDYTCTDENEREHRLPREECQWKNSFNLNTSDMRAELDTSLISVAGYFNEVQPLPTQRRLMEDNLSAGNSILNDRHLAHSEE